MLNHQMPKPLAGSRQRMTVQILQQGSTGQHTHPTGECMRLPPIECLWHTNAGTMP